MCRPSGGLLLLVAAAELELSRNKTTIITTVVSRQGLVSLSALECLLKNELRSLNFNQAAG